MKLVALEQDGVNRLGMNTGDGWRDIGAVDEGLPADIALLLQMEDWQERADRAIQGARPLDIEQGRFLPPVRQGQKILCVGLNYHAHVDESPYDTPSYPVFFPRFHSTLVAHSQPIVRPRNSDQFDYEGELAVVIGRQGRHIERSSALDFVAGYTIFNEASVRDYQFKSPQWTMGKNFDGSGACGPWFVTADELPLGAKGLKIETRINGLCEQSASTAQMIFDIPTLIALASEVMTLYPGDMIVSGTPAGVGFGKEPPVYLKAGDVCEITIEGIGTLRNVVVDEAA